MSTAEAIEAIQAPFHNLNIPRLLFPGMRLVFSPLKNATVATTVQAYEAWQAKETSKYMFLKNAVLVNEWQHQFFCYYLLL